MKANNKLSKFKSERESDSYNLVSKDDINDIIEIACEQCESFNEIALPKETIQVSHFEGRIISDTKLTFYLVY